MTKKVQATIYRMLKMQSSSTTHLFQIPKALWWKTVLFFKYHKLIISGCHGTSCVMIYSVWIIGSIGSIIPFWNFSFYRFCNVFGCCICYTCSMFAWFKLEQKLFWAHKTDQNDVFIYNVRPVTCEDYSCLYAKDVLWRTKDHCLHISL